MFYAIPWTDFVLELLIAPSGIEIARRIIKRFLAGGF